MSIVKEGENINRMWFI